ncbi:MAG: hypothetical protein KF866_03120 [Phycisphaeraceae bacterium]|nr:hypothetical protein [Phycisphaeraceae bacterium]MCW5753312.1 hypothetical protein [Phycisphaeraceae bacterium]
MTMAIIAVLFAMLAPALAGTIRSARGFKCQMAQRSVAFDFQLFVDGQFPGGRGNDELLPGGRFRLETFQEAQYRIDEFWAWGDAPTQALPDAAGNDPLRCPEVRGEVVLRRGTPCSAGAVTPPEHVSFSFNMRLHIAEQVDRGGRLRAMPVYLTESISSASTTPLMWDGNGAVAAARGVTPVFSAPALGSQGIFADDRYWFPGERHNGAANYVFIDGHVETSRRPLHETWQWDAPMVR